MRVRQFHCNKIRLQNCTKTCHFELKNRTNFWEGAETSPGEEGTPLLTPNPLGVFGASFLALAMIRPPLFKPWIRPWDFDAYV